MKKGITLAELLVSLGIIAVLSAFLFPVFKTVREGSRMTRCKAKLRQIGVAIELYRNSWDGASRFGTPSQMGLPPHFVSLDEPTDLFVCNGSSSLASTRPLFFYTLIPTRDLFNPDWDLYEEASLEWAQYARDNLERSITFGDFGHRNESKPPSDHYTWFSFGVQLDTSIRTRQKRGRPNSYAYWSD